MMMMMIQDVGRDRCGGPEQRPRDLVKTTNGNLLFNELRDVNNLKTSICTSTIKASIL